jgi:chromosome segregation ATPase
MDHLFRNSAFGGFNRQDVLNYLENSAKETAQQKEALQQELERAAEAAAQKDAELAELHGRVNRLEREAADRQAKLEQLEVSLAAANAECARQSAELEQLRKEAAQMEELKPDAQAYREIKERTAGIELEAHRRAQAIEEKAQEDAEQLRRRMEQWLQRVSREYDGLRSEVEATVSHAADQLTRAGRTLEQVTAMLGEQDVALESLEQAYADTDPARKVAAPMPIPEV